MSRIEAAFAAKSPKLIPFLTVGDPDLETTARLAVAIAEAGADLIELGIPYSDPVADGPTIQAASQRALEHGVRLGNVFEVVRRIRCESSVPLILFTYCNPVYRYGLDRFLSEAAEAGADGLLMPDLPPEEASELIAAADRHGLCPVFLVAPTSSKERIAKIVSASKGFVYLVSAMGVTGTRAELAADLESLIGKVKAAGSLPVAVGFGVSTPEQAGQISRMGADAVIVGSAIVDRIGRWGTAPDLVEKVQDFVKSLKQGVLF